jgi:hypothetical protein
MNFVTFLPKYETANADVYKNRAIRSKIIVLGRIRAFEIRWNCKAGGSEGREGQ